MRFLVDTVPLTLGDSSVVLQLRAWAPNPIFWDVRWTLTEDGKKRLEAAGLIDKVGGNVDPEAFARVIADGLDCAAD